NVPSSLTISFNYKMGSGLNPNATRTISINLMRPDGTYLILDSIGLNQASGTTVYNFNQTFTIVNPGLYRLAILMGGTTGNGNSRLIFDDLSVNATPQYGPVVNCNSAPIAVNDHFTGFSGEVIVGNLIMNDSDPNGEAITPSIVTTSTDGSVIINTDGSFSFTPNPGFTGTTTSFTYRVTDNGFPAALSNIATVSIEIAVPIILPVNLQSFEAVYNHPNVELKWISSEETNYSHYEVERSTDCVTYDTNAVVLGNSFSSSEKAYSYIDNKIGQLNGTLYYRLTAVDKNGKMSSSAVRTVQTCQVTTLSISTFPNPVVNSARIMLPAAWTSKLVSLEVYNQ